ncbi:MAG TPA: FeoA family protein [Pirellulales bacterium]|jgi:ferrous iron transport protein A|nr:FeoA family protein [Pirellulales bacterium]
MFGPIPLNRLPAGETALIAEIVGRADQVQRIKELGLHDGVEITMVRSGSPCIIRVAGQTLCIRANELLNVLVRSGAPA